METAPAVDMLRITKRYPGVLANDAVDFSAAFGQVHALVGENGAGKSTLMSILYGMQQADSGETRIAGQATDVRSPRDAIALGVGMVHQHFMLVPAFTALENTILGAEPVRLGRTDYRRAEQAVRGICDQFGLALDLRARVTNLSVSAQQKAEIVKALYRRARILILDEPTSVLTPQESDRLFAMLRGMADSGMCVIVITHKLAEVMAGSDRVTVLRQGRFVASMETASTTAADLTRLMVGDEGTAEAPSGDFASALQTTETLLNVADFSVIGERGVPAVDSITFEVRAGEILGVAGVDGNGQHELAEALLGLRRATGTVDLNGMDLTRMSVRRRLESGIAYVPEDRQRDALVSDYTIEENSILGVQECPPYARHGMLDLRAAHVRALDLIERFDVRAAGPESPARFLSGGNQQKLVLGRAMYDAPKLLVACQPTHGLDVGATRDIHHRLLEARAHGMGILLVSYDLDEILALSDRIMVVYRGRVAGIVERAEADRERIGAMMLGAAQ